jgi:hypothetical protein
MLREFQWEPGESVGYVSPAVLVGFTGYTCRCPVHLPGRPDLVCCECGKCERCCQCVAEALAHWEL